MRSSHSKPTSVTLLGLTTILATMAKLAGQFAGLGTTIGKILDQVQTSNQQVGFLSAGFTTASESLADCQRAITVSTSRVGGIETTLLTMKHSKKA